jgi:hypothetical protein
MPLAQLHWQRLISLLPALLALGLSFGGEETFCNKKETNALKELEDNGDFSLYVSK